MNSVLLKIEDIDQYFLPNGKYDPTDETHINLVIEKFRRDGSADGFFTNVHFDGSVVQVEPNDKAEKELQECIEILQLGGYRPALHRLTSLLEHYPYHVHLLYNCGMAFRELGQVEKSIELLTKATDVAPDHVNAWVALAVSHQTVGASEQALAAANKAFEIDGNDPFVLRTLGYLLESTGHVNEAIIHLEKALELSPRDPQVHLVLGKINSSKSPEEARKHLLQVLEYAPGSSMSSQAQSLIDSI